MNTAGKVITCKAAVAWEHKKPLVIEDIQVAPPKRDEVRVKIIASGVCRTDVAYLNGFTDKSFSCFGLSGSFPTILGHEGAGIVESVGEGVTELEEGDHVIPLWSPQCGECKYCLNPNTNLCDKLTDKLSLGLMQDGTSRLTCKGKTLFNFAGISTFSQYTVAHKFCLVKIDMRASLSKVCLLGCGITTGYGAATNTAKIEPGSTCAVWGLGGIGLAVVMGCREAGAKRIIGIDINNEKSEIGKKFGTTDFVNPMELSRPIKEVISEMTNGGCDVTFECIGLTKTIEDALDCCHDGWGQCIVLGVPARGEHLKLNPFQFIIGKSLKGSTFGGLKSHDNVPKLVTKYLKNELMLDEFVTCEMKLDQINNAFDQVLKGETLRTIILL